MPLDFLAPCKKDRYLIMDLGIALDDKTIRFMQGRLSDKLATSFAIEWQKRAYRFGEGEPAFTLIVNNRTGLAALARFDEAAFCEAYMNADFDIEGDMLSVIGMRSELNDRHPLHHLFRRIAPWFIGQTRDNRRAIAHHYDRDEEFFLKFMDESRCYSQAIFLRDDEALIAAQKRKLDFVIDACNINPGDRVLDVGGGWGAFTEHAGRRGIRVTSLTISKRSEAFLTSLIQRLQLPCAVRNEDFYVHTAAHYDAIVILGVMEHLPDYAAVVRQLRRLLKPGGRVYLDASAYWEKYSKPTFVSRHVYPGNHSFFCLHEFMREIARAEFQVNSVYNDRHSYFLTCKAWAQNFDAAREEIIRRWGESSYRLFRLYLWGSAHSFLSRGLDAYRLVLQHMRPAGSV